MLEKDGTISEQPWPSCYPSYLVLRAVINKTSSWLITQQLFTLTLNLCATQHRYRHHETIPTAFVESTMSYMVNKRFANPIIVHSVTGAARDFWHT
ncbi:MULTISPECIES: hypothetical protein [Burkholderiaceae]|nr:MULTISPECIES: hypothetical protein [Burkholderiaceae]MCF2134512.1 hypothetical protein [Mycetohabitans sp. B3]MCG1040544.1 hypothetical protein [Mycetohabitans sp. B7]SIT65444.1 hypothetical protein SAMN04487769_0806 [Burkholderia sp. b14]